MTPRAPTPQLEPLRGVFHHRLCKRPNYITDRDANQFVRSDAKSVWLMNYFIGSNDNHLTSSLNGRRYQSVSHIQGNAI